MVKITKNNMQNIVDRCFEISTEKLSQKFKKKQPFVFSSQTLFVK
jgi:hypothetical protein